MKNQVIGATEFKAKCLGLLDEIGQNGGKITVTKRGRPIATVGPVPKRFRTSEGMLKGKVHVPDELLTADTSDLWDCVRGPARRTARHQRHHAA
jgi:prevent-host-death family protein